MSEAKYLVGDVFDRMAELPDGSVDVVVTSPPFLNLRSYLPSDHPDKGREIGSEPTPAEFLDTLLRLTAEWGRVLAPHGSIAVELGDTYAGGGQGPDRRHTAKESQVTYNAAKRSIHSGGGWPLDKSMCGIPHLYHLSLAYGRNILTGEPSPAGEWRIRNVLCWARPNPPVGCVDDQTEALTPDGWKRHNELADGDLIAAYDPETDSCRFLPAKFVRWHRENEPMVAIDKRVATSQRLTEDHRCWTRTRKTEPHVRLARDLTNDCETLLCAPFDDVAGPAPVTVERAALLGWYIAEGSAKHRQAKIVQSATANPEKVAAIRALLDTDGADYRESMYRRPMTRSGRNIDKPPYDDLVTFTIKGELAEWLNLHHKRLPMAYVTTWPERQAQALFDALIDGDGHRRKNAEGVLFHQQSEAVTDAVQVLALRLGYRAIKTWQPSMDLWQLTLSKDSDRRSVRWTKVRTWEGEGIRRESYTGVVWCPQIETTYWMARRNGRTFITGNSLGDKWRPATSYVTVATKARDRWFDLDAVRTPNPRVDEPGLTGPKNKNSSIRGSTNAPQNPLGAPPLDWIDERELEWQPLFNMPTQPYRGAHYAVFPTQLPKRLIEAMCPREVCTFCGEPRRRIVDATRVRMADGLIDPPRVAPSREDSEDGSTAIGIRHAVETHRETVGWTVCDCPEPVYRRGMVLDPFGGSGTTGAVATGLGRDAILIDIDAKNMELARDRIGMFLTEE